MSVDPLFKRKELFERVVSEKMDVVVIGGGIVGAGVALDAVSRGLHTALFEANDFASGTSSASSKMFHGGLRYLQSLEFGLVKESLSERDLIINHLAPHLAKPMPFIYPLTRRLWERLYIGSGLLLYDIMAKKQLPRRQHLSKRAVLREFPSLKREMVVGGISYYDSIMDDARYTMMVARTSEEYGGMIFNYTPVTKILHDNSGVYGVEVKDKLTNETHIVNSSVVINCTGVWSEDTNNMVGGRANFHLKPSKGVHLVIARNKIFGSMGMIIPTKTSVLFLIPWKQHWIIGTTDTEWNLDVHYPFATSSDVNYILNTVNSLLSSKLTIHDIEGIYSGLRPLITLGSNNEDSPSAISRNHGISVIKPGLISIAGGKFTTYRLMAKDTVDTISQYIQFPISPSVTHRIPIIGANGYHTLLNHVPKISQRYNLSIERVMHLLSRYGNLIYTLLDLCKEKRELLKPIEHSETYLLCEIYYSVIYEKALSISDILIRRTRIYMEYTHRGVASLDQVSRVMSQFLNWSEEKRLQEISSYKELIENESQAQKMKDESLVNAKAFEKYDVANRELKSD